MAVLSADVPMKITVDATCRIEVKPPPSRLQQLSGVSIIACAVATLARVFVGFKYLNDCPQQPKIPMYLLAVPVIPLIMLMFVILTWEKDSAQPQQQFRGWNYCLLCFMGLTLYTCIPAGDWWIFSIYQPNYDPAAADGLYCDKTLYTFALWNSVWETLVILGLLVKFCNGYLSSTNQPSSKIDITISARRNTKIKLQFVH